MLITEIEFTDLEKQIPEGGKSGIEHLATDPNRIYVLAITREGCPACQKQKPKLNELAKSLSAKHGKSLVFMRIHIKEPQGNVAESLRAKDLFSHYFYPTNLILYRTGDRGVIELYRNVSPSMSELKRNIEVALKILVSP
ncbi:MAG: thioredoxin family protein [Promethearchaeati archaeon SRVP18_Atabeyarchaeia-1]